MKKIKVDPHPITYIESPNSKEKNMTIDLNKIKTKSNAVMNAFEEEKRSFAKSQAEAFAEWCIIEGFFYYPLSKSWMIDPMDLVRYSSSELYSQFLLWQEKQQEGNRK
jgi:hypothetical protein